MRLERRDPGELEPRGIVVEAASVGLAQPAPSRCASFLVVSTMTR